ncbi:pilus assembly protein FimV [Allochromatium warmingii]|uniref:Pilus assembly protein FimV n=1 Tax=Allochromatium warmingii TaxID=61595 RepID=A0A1H3IM01_ALLWA|nr:FimV/HubP family polar landmark protein [Allochromatium warmingii]SDY28730.1 pilus assembly protein FimV [Allochromatium warmingii]
MTRKLLLASAIATALIAPPSWALELGALQTESALNQPFSGVIPLTDVRPDELDTLRITIASADAFAKTGIERYYFLTQLRFKPEVTPDGRVQVRLSSREPVREPYLDFLIEAVWPTGNLVKGYTVLLDPPSQLERRAPAVRSARAGSATQDASAVGGLPPLDSNSGGYLSAPGEGFPYYLGPIGGGSGLWTLARSHAIAGATAAQTAMALYRCNQSAFVRGDINRLIAGKTLVIPSRAELFALDAEAAQQEFQAATRGRSAQRAPLTNVTPEMLSRLRLVGTTPGAGAPIAAPAASTSSAPLSGGTTDTASSELLLAIEASETARQEAVELRNRIKELETQLATIQTLLQERDLQSSPIQSPDSPSSAPAIVPETPDSPLVAQSPAPSSESEPTLEPIGKPESSVLPAALESSPPVAENATPAPTSALSADPEAAADLEMLAENPIAENPTGFVPVPTPTLVEPTSAPPATDATTPPPLASDPSAPSATPSTPAPAEPVTAPPPKPQPTPSAAEPDDAAPVAASSTWHSLLLPLAGLAGVTALGILLFSIATARRRRRDQAETDDASDSETLDATSATAPPTETETASLDSTANVSLTKSRTSRFSTAPLPVSTFASQPPPTASAPSASPTPDSSATSKSAPMSELTDFDIDTDEADPISEADIYIAYGRHRDACNLLEKELQRSPKRLELHYKLAEALVAAEDIAQLRERLDHIRTLGGDAKDPAQWARLQLMLHEMSLKLSATNTAPPVAPAPPPKPVPAATPAPTSTVATVAAAGAVAAGVGLAATATPPRTAAPPSEPAAPPPLADIDSEFGLDDSDLDDSLPLDFDAASDLLPAVPTLEPSSSNAESADNELDLDNDVASELDSILPLPSAESDPLHLDLADLAPPPAPSTTPAPVVAPVADSLELPLDLDVPPLLDESLEALDLALGTLPPEPEPVALTAPGVPLLLDLDEDDASGTTSSATASENAPSDLLSSQWQLDSGIWDETATKLDLARAYVEMDDKEAAREILEEVIAEGRDEQRNEARAMLERLG